MAYAQTNQLNVALTELFGAIARQTGALATVNSVKVANASYAGNAQVGILSEGKRKVSFSFNCAPIADYMYSEADTATDRNNQAKEQISEADTMAEQIEAITGSFELAPQNDNTSNVKLSDAKVKATASNGFVTVHVSGLLEGGNINGSSKKFNDVIAEAA